MRTLDFTDHRRELDQNRYVYAVVSRRSKGLSIGINLNPDRICNFDCPYCQVDRRRPVSARPEGGVDLDVLGSELAHLLQLIEQGTLWSLPPFSSAAPHLRRVNAIAVAGDGEPTSAKNFAEAVQRVIVLRAEHMARTQSQIKLILLTNATLSHRDRVRSGLDALIAAGGDIWAKLDAGTAQGYARVNQSKVPLARVLENLTASARRYPIMLQCMFMSWEGSAESSPETRAELLAWQGRIADILAAGGQISHVQIYSVARSPSDARVGSVSTAHLERCADLVRALGLEATVYPGVENVQPQPALPSDPGS